MIELGRSFVTSLFKFPREWMPEVKTVPVEQITPQRIAQIILEQREPTSEDKTRSEEIFNGAFDITHVRAALRCPEADRDDFHKCYPLVNQAIRVALRRLSIQGALREECPNSSKKPNFRGELYTYIVIDIKKLRETAKGTTVN